MPGASSIYESNRPRTPSNGAHEGFHGSSPNLQPLGDGYILKLNVSVPLEGYRNEKARFRFFRSAQWDDT